MKMIENIRTDLILHIPGVMVRKHSLEIRMVYHVLVGSNEIRGK